MLTEHFSYRMLLGLVNILKTFVKVLSKLQIKCIWNNINITIFRNKD